MLYVLLAMFSLIVFYIVKKLVQLSTPRGFAKGVAKSQLLSLYAFRNYSPNNPTEDLYLRAIMTRPGYNMELASNFIADARSLSQQIEVDLKFWMVILHLVAYEYLKRTGRSPLPVMNELREGVLSAIPPDL